MPRRRQRMQRAEAERSGSATGLAAALATTPAPEAVAEAPAEAPAPVAEAPEAADIVRGAPRDTLRETDPREAARLRASELLENLGDLDDGSDQFFIDPDIVPPGWHYEWKRQYIFGQMDPAYQVALRKGGWEPVPAYRHPELMPVGWKGGTVERGGMILMERPQVVTDAVRERDLRRARNQVRAKEEQLSAAPPKTFERGTDRRVQPRASHDYAPIPKDEGFEKVVRTDEQ